jgi:hypothetical protein
MAATARQEEDLAVVSRAMKHARMLKNHGRACRLLLAACANSQRSVRLSLKVFIQAQKALAIKTIWEDLRQVCERLAVDFPVAAFEINNEINLLEKKWEGRVKG